MSGQEQQQATVVQLPIVIDGRYKKQPPYVLRGYKFANGVKCPGTCFVLLISFGGLFTSFVIVCYVMGASLFGAIPAVFIVLSAVASVVIGSYFCVGARRQFKALATTTLTATSTGPDMFYRLYPLNLRRPLLPTIPSPPTTSHMGAQVIVWDTRNKQDRTPAYPPPSPTAQPYDGRTTSNYSMALEDDPPPPYSEIEKNNRY